MNTEQQRIIEDAVTTYGYRAQLAQLQEEAGEAIVAASHYLRGRHGSHAELVEELADLSIMVAQARHYLGEAACDRAVEVKLERLRERMNMRRDARPEVSRD